MEKRITGLNAISEPIKSNTAGASVAVVVSLEELLPPLHPRKSKKKIVDNSGEILCLALISNYKAISVLLFKTRLPDHTEIVHHDH